MAKTPSPTDFTGREKARLEAENAAAVAAAQERMATVAAKVAQVSDEVIDMTATGQPASTVVESSDEEVVIVEPEVKTVEMRVNTDIDNMTLGAGNHYSFKQGQKYRVTSDVYDWLDEQGYVWH